MESILISEERTQRFMIPTSLTSIILLNGSLIEFLKIWVRKRFQEYHTTPCCSSIWPSPNCFISVTKRWVQSSIGVKRVKVSLFNKLHKFGKLVKINIFAPSGRCSNSHKRSILSFRNSYFSNPLLIFVPHHGHYCNYFDILNNLEKLEVVLKFITKIFKL